MEEQASNQNLHDNESPITEFINSVGNLIGEVEYFSVKYFPRTHIDFSKIERSFDLVVRYETDVSLKDVLDCGEDPSEPDVWQMDVTDLDETDRDVEGDIRWHSRHYVREEDYAELVEQYNILWKHFIDLRHYYDMNIKYNDLVPQKETKGGEE